MKYVAIDIETTGLDPQRDQVLHFAAVAADTAESTPAKELPFFERVFIPSRLKGSISAIVMNSGLLQAITNWSSGQVSYLNRGVPVAHASGWWPEFIAWSVDRCTNALDTRIVAAGKNIARFDLPFVQSNFGVDPYYLFHHRVLDVGSMAAVRFDSAYWNTLPSLSSVRDLCGLPLADNPHDALDDARSVVDCISRMLHSEEKS